jgi:hypothetical protein
LATTGRYLYGVTEGCTPVWCQGYVCAGAWRICIDLGVGYVLCKADSLGVGYALCKSDSPFCRKFKGVVVGIQRPHLGGIKGATIGE